MIAVDWSHTKNYAICSGLDTKIVDNNKLLELAKGEKVVIEEGAPLITLFKLSRISQLYSIPNTVVIEERRKRGLNEHKSGIEDDLLDAKLIYELSSNGYPIRKVDITDSQFKLVDLYHQFIYAEKSYKRLNNLLLSMRRQFGDISKNDTYFQLSIHKDEMEHRINSLKKDIEKLAPEPPSEFVQIKGVGKWLWSSIYVIANPKLFPSKQSYRKFCGLVDRNSIDYKFNRQARRIYWNIVDCLIKNKNPYWSELYYKFRENVNNHPDGVSRNRVATKFANYMWEVVNR